jgi:hypothetical protein
MLGIVSFGVTSVLVDAVSASRCTILSAPRVVTGTDEYFRQLDA